MGGAGALRSLAYDGWREYSADADALGTVRASGCTRADGDLVPLTDHERYALERAIVVALSAAFEHYVVDLFRVAALEMGRTKFWAEERLSDFGASGPDAIVEEFAQDGAAARGVSREKLGALLRASAPPKRQFANPTSMNVRELFQHLFPQDDVWVGVTTCTQSDEMVREFVDMHQEDRHDVAHGRARGPLRTGDVANTKHEFGRIVCELDTSVGELVRCCGPQGTCSWIPA